ncbi:Flp family type IVb pilin [Salmonella enterica]
MVNTYLLKGYLALQSHSFVLKNKFKDFCNGNDGVTAVEYAIVVAGVAAVVLAIFSSTGPVHEMLKDTFDTLKTKVTTTIGP